MKLTAQQLKMEIILLGIPPEVISEPSDSIYLPCRSDWLLGDFHRWFFRALEAFQIRDYSVEDNDCDDFCGLFLRFARIAHRRTPEGRGTALPLLQLNYLRNPARGQVADNKHSVVLAITSDRGPLVIEPQVLGRTLTLAPAHYASCTRCSD